MGLLDRFKFAGKAPSLGEQYAKQRANQITSYETSDLWASLGKGERYNPDDLVAQKGIAIYAKMLNDEQVKSVTEFKLNAILGRGWQFKFHHTQLSPEEQKARIAVFDEACRKVRGSFVDAVEGIASGREFGFSVTEKVYGEIKVDGKTFVGLNMLLLRDPSSFRFYADEYGLLQKVEQQVNGKRIELDRQKLIHYVHKPKWDRLYGRSELRSAYRPWYIKDVISKMWPLYLEKFGGGFLAAKREGDEAPKFGTPEYTSLQNALNSAKSLSSIILPRGIALDVHFPATTDGFQRALEYHDLAIAKSQLVPNLLGLSHTGQTGAYAQSQTQFEAFFWTTSTDGERIAECLNEELFRDLGDQNWGDGEYPSFCFKPVSMEHAKWMLTTWKDLLGIKAVLPTEEDERIIRELLEMPERDPDAEPLVDPMAERQQAFREEEARLLRESRGRGEVDERFTRMQQEIESLKSKLTSVSVTVHNPAPDPKANPTSSDLHAGADTAGAVVVPHGELRGCSKEQFSRAVRRVMFSVIERRTDDYAESAVANLAGIIARAAKRALGDDSNLAMLIDEDPEDVVALDISGPDRGKLKAAFRDLLRQAWTLGSDLAANEIDRARGERTVLSVRKAKFASLLDKAAGYFEAQSFRMAGDASDQARKIIQQELQNAVKYGKPLPEVRAAIWARLVAKGLTTRQAARGVETDEAVNTALDELWADTVEEATAYLNTLVRTNTFEALNEARFAEFTDPALQDFVQALEYAAVLDSSTTEICRQLDNRIYKADSELWDEIRPPNHFNCRSVLVPVTTIDGWDGRESEPPTVDVAEGFA